MTGTHDDRATLRSLHAARETRKGEVEMSEMTATMNDMQQTRPRQYRGWLQVVAVVLLLEIGGILGGLTGFLPLGAILSVLLPLAAAWYFLRREGVSWRSLAIGRRLSGQQLLGYTALATVVAYGLVLAAGAIVPWLGLSPPDYSLLSELLEGNLTMYLWFLIPVAWGSAAFGEELLVRGFLLHRLEGLTGTVVALFLQASIFAAAHFYQGVSGMINVFLVGMVFGCIYLRCGRSLLPVFLAHGLVDTIGITGLYLGLLST